MSSIAKWLTVGLILAFPFIGSLQALEEGVDVPKDILIKKNPVALADSVLTKAQKIYMENCIQCHGESGKGDGPMAGMLRERPADLSNTAKVAGITDGQLYWSVTKGRDVVMPPFESKISEEDRWGLVHLLRSISNTKPNNTPKPGR